MVVVVAETVAVGFDGGVVTLRRGEAWDENHPIVRAHPGCFMDLPVPEHRGIEQATAAPGERRGRAR